MELQEVEASEKIFVAVFAGGTVSAMSGAEAGRAVDMQDCHEPFMLWFNDFGTLLPVSIGPMERSDDCESIYYGTSPMRIRRSDYPESQTVGFVYHTDH